MPRKYPEEAQEYCFRLYLKYNGAQHDRIEAEMQRAGWTAWTKQNLYTRGRGANQKVGWIERFGWDEALKLKVQTSGRAAQTSAEKLFLEIESQRERIKAALDAQGGTDRDLVYQHRDYCKLSVEALQKLEAARDNFDGFVAMYERLLEWLGEISQPALSELLKANEGVTERARRHYGE